MSGPFSRTTRVQLTEGIRDRIRRDPNCDDLAFQLDVDPKTIERWAYGENRPSRGKAVMIAEFYGEHADDVIIDSIEVTSLIRNGFSRWGRPILELWASGVRLFKHIHLGTPRSGRDFRCTREPKTDDSGWEWLKIEFDKTLSETKGKDTVYVVSYKLVELVYIDFAEIRVGPKSATGIEYFTGIRHHLKESPPPDHLWFRTWNDGKAVRFMVRSEDRFGLSEMVSQGEVGLPDSAAHLTFGPGPIHDGHQPISLDR